MIRTTTLIPSAIRLASRRVAVQAAVRSPITKPHRFFSTSMTSGQHIQTVPNAGVYNQISDVSRALFEAKARSGLTFEELAKSMGRSEVWVAAIFYGQAKPENEDIESLCKALSVDPAGIHAVLGEGFWPQRGLGPMPPTDPILYRLYEILLVYGQPLKAVINEKFGDGIPSAVDFTAHVSREKNEKGDRVNIQLSGKWLPHAKF